MVYNDFELVSTKRVARNRRMGMMLLRRQWDAMGGASTVFMAGLCGVGGSMLNVRGAVSYAPVPSPVFSGAGAAVVARNGLTLAGPTLVGLCLGVCYFGKPAELKNLIRNCSTYSAEMKAVKDEHYNF